MDALAGTDSDTCLLNCRCKLQSIYFELTPHQILAVVRRVHARISDLLWKEKLQGFVRVLPAACTLYSFTLTLHLGFLQALCKSTAVVGIGSIMAGLSLSLYI